MTPKPLICAFVCLVLLGRPAFSQSAAAHSRQAQEYLRANRPDLAIGELKAVLALEPDNIVALGDLGTLLYFRGDFEEAAKNLRAVVKIQPSLWKTVTLLGMCE
ncbi:MAG: tetratricopeptide repeat protein, partial [Acidobacteriota bacterium]|nr:tetratricopeptide repeat protein [Acidobacteriota bacterium]